jgi:SAM-dependent methyltransferase
VRAGVSETLPLTGERTVPGIPSENYWFRRHVAAYRYAATIAGGRVVDAGCGEGYGAAILSRRARRVVAFDLDAPTLTHARRRYGAPSFVRSDLLRMPLDRSSVDSIVALQVLEHVTDAEAFVQGCARVLRPGGVLILSTPNRDTFPAGLNPFHIREFDASELRDLLGRSFSEVRIRGVVHGPALRFVDRLLEEPIQHRLIRTAYTELPPSLRASLRLVTSDSFRLSPRPEDALDLFAVCRTIEP